MVDLKQDANVAGVITGDAIQAELRKRKGAFLEMTVPMSSESVHIDNGWEVIRRNKKTLRVRKHKPVDQKLEDDVWVLLALMGFGDMSQGRHFKIPVSSNQANVPPKQIDVLAVDAETALVVECKASRDLRQRSLQKDLNETRALQQPIREWINSQYQTRRRVCFLYATRNVRWSQSDRERARNHQIRIVRDPQIGYFRKLVDIIGPAARHQLQAHLLQDSPIQGLNSTVPALRGTFGETRFYQFAIEPERLLKLAYVSHRAKIDAEAIGTYQRLLRKKRLKDIAQHINETGGVFPTNVVVNFRQTRSLRFDPSGPVGDAPTVLGTLHLPNTYKSAWVIDGQHRLYGFARTDWASKGKVPVLAFAGLAPSEEVALFVDINNKQVKVPRSLLVELEPELNRGSDQPEQELKGLHAQLGVDLSESDDSPLLGRVTSEWDTNTENKPVTLPQLVAAIRDSQLLGAVRSGVLYPGHLYGHDSQSTLDRARSTIEKYLALFAEGSKCHWHRDSRPDGFLCTNLGISALLRVFKTALDQELYSRPDLEYPKLSPDAIVGTVNRFVSPIVKWFNRNYDLNRSRFHGRYGSGAPIKYSFELMQIIHDQFPQFDPPGLAKHIQEHSIETISHAQQLITEIEDALRRMTLAVLESKYSETTSGWWREGVPQTVRGQAAQKSETSEEGGEPHQFLELIDYKKIAEQSKHWRDFERYFTIDKTQRSKSQKLAWMDRLSAIRNRVSHSGRRDVTNDEIDFLEEVWVHVLQEKEDLNV